VGVPGLAMGVLALAVVGFVVAMGWGRLVLWRRSCHHDGTYVVRLVPTEGEPWLLAEEFGSADRARAAATETLVGAEPRAPAASGQVLARRHDGTWDVVDEVHVLG